MKHLLHSHHPFRIFWFSVLLTLGLGSLIFSHMGVSGLWLFTILVVLEVTFSFDNAVINSKVWAGNESSLAEGLPDGWYICGGVCRSIHIANCYRDDCERSWIYGCCQSGAT